MPLAYRLCNCPPFSPGEEDAQGDRQNGAEDHPPLFRQNEGDGVRPNPEEPDYLPEKCHNNPGLNAVRKIRETKQAVPAVHDAMARARHQLLF